MGELTDLDREVLAYGTQETFRAFQVPRSWWQRALGLERQGLMERRGPYRLRTSEAGRSRTQGYQDR